MTNLIEGFRKIRVNSISLKVVIEIITNVVAKQSKICGCRKSRSKSMLSIN